MIRSIDPRKCAILVIPPCRPTVVIRGSVFLFCSGALSLRSHFAPYRSVFPVSAHLSPRGSFNFLS